MKGLGAPINILLAVVTLKLPFGGSKQIILIMRPEKLPVKVAAEH